MSRNLRSLEIFNILEVYKRREYKLFRQTVGLIGITTGVTIASLTFLPEAVAIIPTAIVGLPATYKSLKIAKEADKISTCAGKIFEENKNQIINFKIHNDDEKQEFTEMFPVLSRQMYIKK